MARGSPSPRIFVSYARSDGKSFARKLRRRLEEESGLTLWQDLAELEGGRGWWDQIAAAIRQVEHLVLIMTPAAARSSIVKEEWRLARREGVCVVPVVGDRQVDLSRLPSWMRRTHFVDLREPEQWPRFVRTLQGPCRAPRAPFMTEDLPDVFVSRPREHDALIDLLLAADREEPVAITAALRGAGGYGKTTLARALCHDERIVEAFHDGVLWITLGQDPGDLTGRVEDLIAVLSGERPGFTSLETATARLVELLADRALLLVIDDLWNQAHLRPFLQGGPHCARLVTTRDDATLPPAARRVEVNAMRPAEALDLLSASLTLEEPDAFVRLARRLGEWPLLLKLVNRVLRQRVDRLGQTPGEALAYVDKALDRRGLAAFDARDPVDRDQAVAATLEVSFEPLSDQERARLRELAIFPQDVAVPLDVVGRLWRATAGLDDFDTETLCEGLFRQSLLLRLDLTTRVLLLHDVVRDYLKGSLGAAWGAVHARLLDTYQVRKWAELSKAEPYLWHQLAYHLMAAGRARELRALLFDFEWLRTKLEATEPKALIADFDALAGDGNPALVRQAIRLAGHVLARDKRQLASQLVGRLSPFESREISSLLEAAKERAPGPWLRPITASLLSPLGPLQQTLAAHQGRVWAVAITPDGRQVVSGSGDTTLKVWDLSSGEEIRTLRGHDGAVTAVAVTPSGRFVVSGSDDATLKVWDLETGEALRTLRGHRGEITAVAIAPDGRRAVSGSQDDTLGVWDLGSGDRLHSLEGHIMDVLGVSITPDGRRAVSVSLDATVRVWDLENGKELHTLGGNYPMAITPDGRKVLSASEHDMAVQLKVSDLDSGEELFQFDGHELGVRALAVAPDGRLAVSGSYEIKVWDLENYEELRELEGHAGGVEFIAVTPDGRGALSTSASLKYWDLESGVELRTLQPSGATEAVAITPDGRRAVSASSDRTLKVWDLGLDAEQQTLRGLGTAVESIAIAPDGRRVLSCSGRTLKLWNAETGEECRRSSGAAVIWL